MHKNNKLINTVKQIFTIFVKSVGENVCEKNSPTKNEKL